MVSVCIDPSHGGYDPGAVGPTRLQEKVVALEIALEVGRILQTAGIQVNYTRTGDQVPWPSNERQDLAERVRIANRTKADLFVSVHCNSGGATAKGMEVYTLPGPGPADQVAESIVRAWTQLLPQMVIRKDLSDGDSDKEANYYVLKYTDMPAVLVEVCFISNPAEEALLKQAEFKHQVALAIATGIANYFGVSLPASPDLVTIVVKDKVIVGRVIDGRTWGPVAEVLKALNVPYTWDGATRTVRV